MRSIATKIGTVVGYAILIPIGIFILVAMLPFIIFMIALDWWRKLFIQLRHDPHHKLPKRYRIYAYNDYPEGKKALRDYFDKFIAVIQKDADITDISTVDSNRVKLKQFNIAEGYTQSEMAMGIAALLSGSYEVQNRNLFGRRTVIISVGNSKVYGVQVISKTKPGKI